MNIIKDNKKKMKYNKAKVEMTTIASPEAKVEMTVIASPEATVEMTVEPNVKIPKKRGRKPKGGTIIANIENKSINIEQLQNIILHLKCNISELQNNTTQELTTFQFKNNNYDKYCFERISNLVGKKQ